MKRLEKGLEIREKGLENSRKRPKSREKGLDILGKGLDIREKAAKIRPRSPLVNQDGQDAVPSAGRREAPLPHDLVHHDDGSHVGGRRHLLHRHRLQPLHHRATVKPAGPVYYSEDYS